MSNEVRMPEPKSLPIPGPDLNWDAETGYVDGWNACHEKMSAYADARCAELREEALTWRAIAEGEAELRGQANEEIEDLKAERDALAAKVKELEANDWQTLDRPLLKVFYMAGDDPFVYAAHGRIAGVIEDVEKDLRENPPAWFEDHGDGDYTFRASYCEGEHGEYGRCVFPAGWELDLLAFEPLKDAAIDAAGGGHADK